MDKNTVVLIIIAALPLIASLGILVLALGEQLADYLL